MVDYTVDDVSIITFPTKRSIVSFDSVDMQVFINIHYDSFPTVLLFSNDIIISYLNLKSVNAYVGEISYHVVSCTTSDDLPVLFVVHRYACILFADEITVSVSIYFIFVITDSVTVHVFQHCQKVIILALNFKDVDLYFDVVGTVSFCYFVVTDFI